MKRHLSLSFFPLHRFWPMAWVLWLGALCAPGACARARVSPVPPELRSDCFRVTVDGRPAHFAHAAMHYYFLSFDLHGKTKIAITAPTQDYWKSGVEVQPWRLAIRPHLNGDTITFTLRRPAKISITRPGDHLAGAEMLFLFANPPEKKRPAPNTPGVRYYKPGVYRENIDAHSGDRIYLAAGAVLFGSLNLWQVDDVKVSGRGVIVYDGPQNPNTDEGWMHRRNWHCIVMDNARQIEIEGITCIVRSRTWMIQMRDSRGILFNNVKVIGGSPGNANQDGMDWLGGGDTIVRDSFFRAADDVFAIQGNWDGYSQQAMTTPGHNVSNILIENSVLSTSISNILRVGWPQKTFNSHNVMLRDSDVIHMGIGSCGVPFALFELWADPAGKGLHSEYRFDNLRLEDWYTLVQLRQPNPAIRNISFTNIWAEASPSLLPSVLAGDVSDVRFSDLQIASRIATKPSEIPLESRSGAAPAVFRVDADAPRPAFSYTAGPLVPGAKVTFDASVSAPGKGEITHYRWFFGDGQTGRGRVVHHRFRDASGSWWDGSGRYHVLLQVTDKAGRQRWTAQPVIVAKSPLPASRLQAAHPGLHYAYYEGTWEGLPDFAALTPLAQGASSKGLDLSVRQRDDRYGLTFEGFLRAPAGGGYTFTLLGSDAGRLEIDGREVAVSPRPFANVCGSPGNAVQVARGSVVLQAGEHRFRLAMTHSLGRQSLGLKWEGPGILLTDVPPEAFEYSAEGAGR